MSDLSLTSLTLSHFRSHHHTSITVDPRPVAIFGPNGAGKTNILEAISLLSPGRGLRRSSALEMTRRPEALGWKITAIVQKQDQAFEIATWSEEGAARQLKIDDKSTPQVELARIARVLWLIPSMDRLWIEGAEGRRRFLDRMTLSFTPEHAEATLVYEKAMRQRNKLLKEQIRDAHWYVALENQMAEAGAAIHRNRLATIDHLTQAQAQAQTAFPTVDLTLFQSEGDLTDSVEDLKTALADTRSRDLAAGRSLIGPHRSDMSGVFAAKGVSAKDCSTGEQKALLISLILANARAIHDLIGITPILLLDEVSAHLDSGRRAALYDEICTLKAQAWMTGTGAELFESLGPRAQSLEVDDQGGVSHAHLT